MRINIYAHLIIIEILDEIYARVQNWSSVEYIDSNVLKHYQYAMVNTRVQLQPRPVERSHAWRIHVLYIYLL